MQFVTCILAYMQILLCGIFVDDTVIDDHSREASETFFHHVVSIIVHHLWSSFFNFKMIISSVQQFTRVIFFSDGNYGTGCHSTLFLTGLRILTGYSYMLFQCRGTCERDSASQKSWLLLERVNNREDSTLVFKGLGFSS